MGAKPIEAQGAREGASRRQLDHEMQQSMDAVQFLKLMKTLSHSS